MLDEYTISNPIFKEQRRIWVWESSIPSSTIFLFLDGELYLDRVKAVDTLENLAPPCTSIFLSYGTSEDRAPDFTCNSSFSQFLSEDLLPWIAHHVQPFSRVILCGLSLSGLAAIYAASQYPGVFAGILAQSPSAWWNDEWLVEHGHFEGLSATPIWLSVGTEERDENVTHSPHSLFQRISQLHSCRKLAAKIESFGITLQYHEFEGGHDPVSWADELPDALSWLQSQVHGSGGLN